MLSPGFLVPEAVPSLAIYFLSRSHLIHKRLYLNWSEGASEGSRCFNAPYMRPVRLRTCGIKYRKIRENEPWYLREWPWLAVSLKEFGLDLLSSGEIMQVSGSHRSRACFKQVKVIKVLVASCFVESYGESWFSCCLWLRLWFCGEAAPQRGKVCIKRGI